jgi:predicted nicotinamide N-methyase
MRPSSIVPSHALPSPSDPEGDLVEEVVPVGDLDLAVLRPRDSDALIDEHAFEYEEFLPYWAQLWPSGVALARAVGSRALGGMRVVEVGCGLGLPSLVAARAGARVLATDWAPAAVELLRANAARNGAELDAAIIDWASPGGLLQRAPFDLVLAADLLYERRNLAVLADLLPRLGGEVLLSDPGRPLLEEFLSIVGVIWRRPPVYRLR